MMKKTQIIEILKSYKKTYVTFFSILLFVSFGMAAFLGLDWSKQSISDSFESYFDEGNLQEFEFSYPLGVRDSDMAIFDAIPEIDETEGRYESFRFLNRGDQKIQIHFYSITERINTFTFLDGKLPTKENEILVEKAFAENSGIKIGDTLSFLTEGTIGTPMKNTGSFIVSGIVKTAEYTSIYSDTYGVNPMTGCAVKGFMYLSKEAFDTNAFTGYSSVLLRCDDMNTEKPFTDGYNHKANQMADDLREKLSEHFSEKLISLRPSSANPSYISAKAVSDIFSGLRIPLAGLFVVVGILVCFFSVSRSVFDQAKLIGTKKALGFYKREITASFLIFSLLSTVLGVLLGAVFARYILENILNHTLQSSYPFNRILTYFSVKDVLIFGLFEILTIVSATLLASASVLKKSAYTLLTGGDAHTFDQKSYMKTRAFRKLSVLGKVITNNLFSEPRRVLSTIIGVMGITALIVSSMSLNNFVQDSFRMEMDEITKYDSVLYVKQDDRLTEEIKSRLDAKGVVYSGILSTYVTITTPDDQNIVTSLYVVEDEAAFFRLFDLHNGKNKVDHLNGLYSSLSYMKEYESVAGDTIKITDAYGQIHEVGVTGFFDYYLTQNQLIIDRATYEKEFGGTFAVNAVLFDRGDDTLPSLADDLSDCEGFINADDFYQIVKESFDIFAGVFTFVVSVYILLAVLMAFIVLMNLLDMLIKEKKYELIVLMINGFRKKQTKAYITVDTVVLTVIGALLGLCVGVIMGNVSLGAYYSASIYFKGGINARACIVGTSLTFVLVFIVTIINIRKIDRFKLGDINK